MSLTAIYDAALARVRLAATALDDDTEALFERSVNGVTWTTVRGGSAVTISGADTAALDDYEFVDGVVNTYRVTAGADVFTDTITPDLGGMVWLKSIIRPFLNRAVVVGDYSDIERPARNGVFPVIGRTMPVAVTDVRLSRRWTMQLNAATAGEADAIDLVFASGDPLYIQVPADSDVPGGYIVAGDVTRSRRSRVGPRRYLSVPCTEVAPPGPEVVGATVTWASIVGAFGTWADVAVAFPTWADVLEYVASPDVVIVP